MTHSIAPVFEIYIAFNSFFLCQCYQRQPHPRNAARVFSSTGALSGSTNLGQQVHYFGSGFYHPFYGCIASTKVSTSTLFSNPFAFAHFVIRFTASNSLPIHGPMRSQYDPPFTSVNKSWAMVNFSEAENDTPLVCSPSRSVVSIISICRGEAGIVL